MSLINNNNNNMPKCNQCQIEIKHTNIGYYHCINGCEINNIYSDDENDNNDYNNEFHCVFLCEICANKYIKQYKYCIDNNNTNNNRLAFNGCFVDLAWNGNELWYEAIKMECDGNDIFYELLLSSETNKRFVTEAKVINKTENGIIFENKGRTNFRKGILSLDGLILSFIDDSNDSNTFERTCVFCRKCGANTMFMLKNMFPSRDITTSIYCDTHDIYYEKEKLLNINRRCLSFKCLEKEYNTNIYKQDFYFSCVKCNEFDQCSVCTLIQYENKFKNKNKIIINENINNYNNQPSNKRQRIDNNKYIERNV
eukprot:75632_1